MARTVSTGRTTIKDVSIPRFCASFTAYVQNEDMNATCIYMECEHAHETIEAAQICSDRMARKVERHPEQFPQVARYI